MSDLIDWIGVRLGGGRYTVIQRVGQGNMGQVYRAFDAHLGTEVVVKFPVRAGAGADDPEFFERFDREIRALIRLSHPHVVKVIDVGRHEGHPYVVMQFLEGGSLRDRMDSGPGGEPGAMEAQTLSGWLPDVARALDFIHAQGFVHRDVKPANILFDAHGNAFLGDFGVMKALSAGASGADASALTAPGFLLGTPNYVAPEVVMGEAPGPRADQYALAMTVHEVLTGTNAMAGPTPSATMVNQINLEPPR
jgi:serine/threonine-protein kinase